MDCTGTRVAVEGNGGTLVVKDLMLTIILCTSNATTICCFTYLAVHFETPWLVLGALFFYHWYKVTDSKKE